MIVRIMIDNKRQRDDNGNSKEICYHGISSSGMRVKIRSPYVLWHLGLLVWGMWKHVHCSLRFFRILIMYVVYQSVMREGISKAVYKSILTEPCKLRLIVILCIRHGLYAPAFFPYPILLTPPFPFSRHFCIHFHICKAGGILNFHARISGSQNALL